MFITAFTSAGHLSITSARAIQFNIILLPTLKSFKWYLTVKFAYQNPVRLTDRLSHRHLNTELHRGLLNIIIY